MRSTTLQADLLLDLAQLRGRQLVVEDDEVRARLGADAASVATLPEPRNVEGSGLGRSCSTRSTTSAPAASREPRQLVERALGVQPARAAEDQADERRAFASVRSRARRACQHLLPVESRRRAPGAAPDR